MEVAFALLADAANVSREGKLNVLGAFDRIYGSKFPLTWPRMVLVTRFIASAAEFGAEKSLEIVTLDADGKRLGGATGKMRVPPGPPGRRPVERTQAAGGCAGHARAHRHAVHRDHWQHARDGVGEERLVRSAEFV